jgi:hypothetical protein
MEHKKMSEFLRLTRIFPRRALNFWNARREKKRTELYNRLVDADLSLKGLLQRAAYEGLIESRTVSIHEPRHVPNSLASIQKHKSDILRKIDREDLLEVLK